MELNEIKAATAGAWIFAIGAAGLLAGAGSPPSWLVLAGYPIVPPLMMMRYWHHPDEIMSHSIQRSLR